MLAKTFCSSVYGVDARIITVEVNVSQGSKFFMVGLPDNAVKESQQRVEAALKNNGFSVTRRKTIINLAPADIRKEGSSFDLSLAIGVLAATGQLLTDQLDKYI